MGHSPIATAGDGTGAPWFLLRRFPAQLLVAGVVVVLTPMAAVQAQPAIAQAPSHSLPDAPERFSPSNASQVGLAEHLRRQGYVFYGAWWCPACRQQKSLFGQQGAQRLPYLECEKDDAGQKRCSEVGIRAYPTWIRGNERRTGVLSLEELKTWSGYLPGGAAPGGGNP